MTTLEMIFLNATAISFAAIGVAVFKWRRARRETCGLEDQVVDFYAQSLNRMDETLDQQESAIQMLRDNARKIMEERDDDIEDTAADLQSALSCNRGQVQGVAEGQEASRINWENFFTVKASCDDDWMKIVDSLLRLNVKPLLKIKHLEALESQRRELLKAAEIRVEELEKQIHDLLRRTFTMNAQSLDETSAATDNAFQEMEQSWDASLKQARQDDESLRKGIGDISDSCSNMNRVNDRLSSLTQMLRGRQKAMADRIKHLEELAEMTPRLKEELKTLTKQNNELQSALKSVEESNQEFKSESSKLHETIETLRKQPSRTEVAEAKVAQDRQVMQLLREQNQRLLFELDEANENIEEAKAIKEEARRTAEANKIQYEALEKEIQQLLDHYDRLENSLDGKDVEAAKLLLELRRIRSDRDLIPQ